MTITKYNLLLCFVVIISVICLLLATFGDNVRDFSGLLIHRGPFIQIKCSNTTNVSAQCDFVAFRDHLCLDEEYPVIRREYISRCDSVMYNRVPKCASTTVSMILKANRHRNNYTYLTGPASASYKYKMNEQMRNVYTQKMNSFDRFVLSNHLFFFNFTDYLDEPLLYINVIREPVAWFVSAYSYFHTQSPGYRGQWWNKMPMIECIRSQVCFNHIINQFGSVHFLCGNHMACNDSRSGLQLAKKHVEEEYLVVGITEQLKEFMETLEFLLPAMFADTVKTFTDMQNRIHRRSRTRKKERIDDKLATMLRLMMEPEMDLYAFVRQKFHKLWKAVRVLKT